MANQCPVPGCEVLIYGHRQVCSRHWGRLPISVWDDLNDAATDEQLLYTKINRLSQHMHDAINAAARVLE